MLLPALLPLTAPGFLQGHDYMDAPWRSLELKEALLGGVLFPRWSPDLFYGYGFPIFDFYSPLSFYLVVFLEIVLPVNMVEASKLAFGFFLVSAGLGAYLLAWCATRRRHVAVLAGLLYCYAPFILGEIYVRSTLAGLAGHAFLPFVLAAFIRLCQTPTLLRTAIAALSVVTMILVHNISAVVAIGLSAGIVGLDSLLKRDMRGLAYSSLALTLGVIATSFFWLPALMDIPLTHTEFLASRTADYRFHFVDPIGEVNSILYDRFSFEPYQLTRWGLLDLHLAYPYGSPPYKASLLQGLLVLASVSAVAIRRKTPPLVGAFLVFGMVLFFLHTSWSAPLWEVVPILHYFQFPWRLIGAFSMCLAVAASWAMVSLFDQRAKLALPLLGMVWVVSALWMLPTELLPFERGTQISREALIQHEYRERNRIGTMSDGQFLPLSVQWDKDRTAFGDLLPRFDQSYPKENWVAEAVFLAPNSKAWILSAERGHASMRATVEAGEPTRVAFHTVYFPGWVGYLDGKQVPIEGSGWKEYEEKRRVALGVVEMLVPEGTHEVSLIFEGTPLHRAANMAGQTGMLAIVALLAVAIFPAHLPTRRKTQGAVMVVLVVVGSAPALYTGYQAAVHGQAPPPIENNLVRDLLADASGGKLQITAPPQGNPNDYVHVKPISVGGTERTVIFMHPPGSASTRLWVPQGARLELGMGVDEAVWSKPGDGVTFNVSARYGGTETLLYSGYLDPKNNQGDRLWEDISVDLSPLAGREVELVISTSQGQSGEYDWAGWSSARVVLGPR